MAMRFLIILVFIIMMAPGPVMAQSPATDPVTHLTTPDGIEFGLWGGNKNYTPAPLLFVLASTIDETLGVQYYRQCGDKLGREHGWLCVSLDLPFHGKQLKDTSKPMLVGWAAAIEKREDFIAPNNYRMKRILDYLIEKGYADANRVYICGTSRGGYLGLQFAAVEPRVRAVTAFGPPVDLLAVREFSRIPPNDVLPDYELNNHLMALAEKDIWLVVGDRDERVGTDLIIQFARSLSKMIYSQQLKGKVELNVMSEPRGHTAPPGSVERGVNWLLAENNNH